MPSKWDFYWKEEMLLDLKTSDILYFFGKKIGMFNEYYKPRKLTIKYHKLLQKSLPGRDQYYSNYNPPKKSVIVFVLYSQK